MNRTSYFSSLALALSLAALAGCASGPENVERDFGNSVRHMQQMQAANPSAPADALAIDHGDGQRLENVLQAYRKDVAKPEEVKKDILINVSGQQ